MKFVNTELPDIIELKNIHQSYDNGKTIILEDFSLLIEDQPKRGQFITLMGESGCGKCLCDDTIITIRNKQTKIVEEITIKEFMKRFP